MTLATRVSTLLSSAAGTRLSGKLSGGDGAALPPLVAPDAGTDSGVWASAAQTLNGSAATGGVAPITYLWTVQSGGTGTFDDATAIDAVFTATSPGAAVVLRLTATDAALQTAYDEVTIAATWDAVITNGTGFTRHWWFEASDGTVTRDGGNLVSQVSDRWADAYHMVQAAGGNKPLYQSTGGPNGLPAVSLSGTNDYVINSAIALTAGRRLFRIAVLKVVDASAYRATVQGRDNNAIGGGDGVISFGSDDAHHFDAVYKPNAGSQTLIVASTSPAIDTDWHIQSLDYAAGGTVWKIDNAATDPNASGSTAASAIESISWGHDSVSGGAVAVDICVEAPTAAVKAFIYAYLDGVYFP